MLLTITNRLNYISNLEEAPLIHGGEVFLLLPGLSSGASVESRLSSRSRSAEHRGSRFTHFLCKEPG